jgi:tetratricopeptide (TPR) repeat protein
VSTPADGLDRWRKAGVAATAVLALSVPLYLASRAVRGPKPQPPSAPLYVGSEACRECHAKAYDGWKGSHHALAMLAPRPSTVLGDFRDAVFEESGKTWRFFMRGDKYFVRTDDLAGPPAEFEIAYTFGWTPLQQYIVQFPGGRLQCLSVAWDVPKRRWFSLYPGQHVPPTDWLHWTRPALNWNTMCSQCHSTGVRKRYDPEGDTYSTTWAEIFVGCEACHGPGSLHVAWGKKPAMGRPQVANAALTVKTSSMAQRDLVNLCAPCHSRRAELRDMDRPAAEPLDAHLPTLLAPGLFYPDGQILDEVYEVHSFLQSKMYDKGVRCSDCHDVHSAKRYKEGNELCLRCHRADTYDIASHHFHKKVYQGKPSDGATCTACHMPGRNYMVVHFRRDHSMRVPRPDLSQAIGTPNACSQAGCHADKPLKWVVAGYDKWYGAKRKPHYGTVLAAAREGRPEARPELLALAGDRLRPAIVRATALDLLWGYPGEDSTKLLEQAMDDEDALIRRTAVNRFRHDDAAHFVKAVAQRLKDPVLAVRAEAASRLAGAPSEALGESQKEAFRAALEEYRSILAYSADMPSGRHNWALLEDALGRPGEAEKQYRKALAIDDQFYMSAANLAIDLSRQGRNEEAEGLLRQALRASPRNAASSFNLGLLLAEMGKNDQAEAALRQALEADPSLAPAAYNLAVLVGARDPAQAASLCRRAAELQPGEPRYAFSRAYYELQQGKESDATATLEALVATHPAFGDAVLMLGDLYGRKGRSKQAAELYDRALAAQGLADRERAEIAGRRRALP